jgi:hypothetical protein
MTTSVIDLLPAGGSAGWDQVILGYDTNGIGFPSNTTTDVIFSLTKPAVAGPISKITIAAVMAGSQAAELAIVKISNVLYGAGSITLNSLTHTWYYVDYALNPATGVAWTWDDMESLLAGIRVSLPYTRYMVLYQYKVQVTYTPAAYVPPALTKGCIYGGCGSPMF